MTDKHLQRIIEDNVAEKYVSKYWGARIDDETKQDIVQEIYLILLEAMQTDKYQALEDKFSYLCTIIKQQIYSTHSHVARKYIYDPNVTMTNNYSNINQLSQYAENSSEYND